MKKFYVVDPNGTIKSSDGTKTYKVLKGKALKEFLSSKEGKERKFFIQQEENGDTIGIEVPIELYKKFKKDIDREAYLREVREELDISEISIERKLLGDEEGNGEEILADENQDVELQFIREEELAILKNALQALTEQERWLINALYFENPRKTERQLAEILGIKQKNVNARKKRIFEKIKTFFKN